MTCHEYDGDIDDYVDETLPADRVAAVEAHLASCSRCRALTADFRVLRTAASTLEVHTPPPHVWTRLQAELHASEARRTSWLPWVAGISWRSAAATAALIAVLAGGTWISWRQVSDSAIDPPLVANGSVPAGSPVEDVARAISQMQGIVQDQSSILPTETKAAYEAGIGEIDDASTHARAILAEQPSNEIAQQSLLELLQSKLSLLQEMIALINEMRQGNQEEAARIVSGMEQ